MVNATIFWSTYTIIGPIYSTLQTGLKFNLKKEARWPPMYGPFLDMSINHIISWQLHSRLIDSNFCLCFQYTTNRHGQHHSQREKYNERDGSCYSNNRKPRVNAGRVCCNGIKWVLSVERLYFIVNGKFMLLFHILTDKCIHMYNLHA